MATTTLTMRIDEDLKRQASSIVEHYGLDLSTAARLFFTQIVNTGAIPVRLDYEQPNAQSLMALAEANSVAASKSIPSFTDVDSAMNHLGLTSAGA